MTQIVPVPQSIEGCPVVAAITVPPHPGEPPHEFIVICQRVPAPSGAGPYVTWRVSTSDGREWAASNGHSGLTWPQAVTSFSSRASLPAPPRLPTADGREAAG